MIAGSALDIVKAAPARAGLCMSLILHHLAHEQAKYLQKGVQ